MTLGIESWTMLLGLLKNIDGCVSDTPKWCIFGVPNTGAAIFLESPSNIGQGLTAE